MSIKARRDELRKLINDLLRGIAQANKASAGTNKVGDAFQWDKKVYVGEFDFVSRKIMGPGGSWIIADSQEVLWSEVIAKLRQLKPNAVSSYDIDKKLRDLIWKYKSKDWQLSQIGQDITNLIDSINDAGVAVRKVFLPIWGLVIRASSFVIGDVEFKPRIQCPKLDEDLTSLDERLKTLPSLKIQTIAITEAMGADDNMILENAEAKVNRALNILRALKYPVVTNTASKELGIMGTYSSVPKIYAFEADHFREESEEKVSEELSGASLSAVVDTVISEYEAKFHFANIGLYTLGRWLTSTTSDFERSLLRAAELLGEATKPDTLESKFLKVALAVDAMIGDEPSELIPDKGLRARIAERAAFLLADKYEDRRIVYDDTSKFFKKRGKLAHGVLVFLSEAETEKFATYARTILVRVLSHLPTFKDINDLAEWVLRESFKGRT